MHEEALTAEVVVTREEFDALQSEWDNLLERSEVDCIFLRWGWIAAWLDSLPTCPELFIVTLRNVSGDLLGLSPQYVTHLRLMGVLRYRVLRVLAEQDTGGEYGDWIVDSSATSGLRRSMAEAHRRFARAWDLIWMPRLPGWNRDLHETIDAAESVGLSTLARPCTFSAIALPSTLERFERQFSAQRRQHLARLTRRIMGRPNTEILSCARTDSLQPMLEALFRLHGLRWRAKGESGAFAKNQVTERFYRRYAPVALEEGTLRLHVMRHGSTIEAAQLGFVYGGCFHQLQEGFDPDAPTGVGNVLRREVIRRCIEIDGVEMYDFLGGFSEHKRRWGSEERSGYQLVIGAPHLRSKLLLGLGVWPSGRFMTLPRRP